MALCGSIMTIYEKPGYQNELYNRGTVVRLGSTMLLVALMALFIFVCTGSAGAAVNISQGWEQVATALSGAGTKSCSQTTSYTINPGANRLLLVAISVSVNAADTAPSTATVTWSGKLLTSSVGPGSGNRVFPYIFYLKESDIGSDSVGNLIVTMGGSTIYGFVVFAAVYKDVDQTTTLRNTKNVASTSTKYTTISTTATFTAGDQGVFLAGFGLNSATATSYSSVASGWTGSSSLFAGSTGSGGAWYGGIGVRNGTGAATNETVSMTIGTAERASIGIISLVPATYTSTTTTLGAVNSPQTYGAVAFAATVSPSAASGTVTFKDGTTTLGTVALSGGSASFTATASQLTVSGSPHAITAEYNGDSTYGGSISSASSLSIAAKKLFVNGLSASSKTYNGTTSATLTGTGALLTSEAAGTGTGADGKPYTGDAVSLVSTAASSFTGTFASKNVANGIAVNVTGNSLTGAQAGNYTLGAQTTEASPGLTANITQKPLSIAAPTVTKVYDGSTTSGTVTVGTLSGLVGAETVTATGIASAYTSKNVGSSYGSSVSYTLVDGTNGGLAANYSLTNSVIANAVITARLLTVTANADSKTYDGGMTSVIAPSITSGILQGGDTANFIEVYSNKHVGTDKTLTPSGTVVDGNGGSNYSYVFVPQNSGTIVAKVIDVTAVTDSKTADGNVTSTGVPTVNPSLVVGDTSGFSQTFDTAAAGTSKTLAPTGSVNDGNSGNNHRVIFHPVYTGTITAAAPSKLVMKTGPSASVTAGATLDAQPAVYVEDSYGNVVTDDNSTLVTATVGAGTGPLTGMLTATASAGTATFSGLAAPTTAQSGLRLTFTSSGLASVADTTGITVAPGILDHFAISEISTPQTAGTAFDIGAITAQDAYDNTVRGFSGTGNTVAFSGTAGITGTSAVFSSGVLSHVSVTPANAGDNLSFIVSGGSPNKTGTATIATILHMNYVNWVNGTFAEPITDVVPAHDPDNDRLTNLQEYAFGTDPTVASITPVAYVGNVVTPGVPAISKANERWHAVFGRRADYRAVGLSYTVEFSATLSDSGDWVPVEIPEPPVASDTVKGIAVMSVPFPNSIMTPNGPRKPRFFKVGVSQH